MSDGEIFLLYMLGVLILASTILVVSAVVSNRKNVETLEEANERLMETRKQYNSYRVHKK